MNNFPKPYIVDQLKKEYPPGTRVMLLGMEDPHGKLRPGDRATVVHVDDIGTVHCKWDNGSGLGLAYGEDEFRKLTEQELQDDKKVYDICMDEACRLWCDSIEDAPEKAEGYGFSDFFYNVYSEKREEYLREVIAIRKEAEMEIGRNASEPDMSM